MGGMPDDLRLMIFDLFYLMVKKLGLNSKLSVSRNN